MNSAFTHIFWDQPSCRSSPVSHGTWRSFVYGSVLSLVSCLPALGANSLGALGGWVGIKNFFSDYSAVKRCLSRAYVRRKPGLPWCIRTGVRPPAGTALVLLVAGCFFRRQSSVQRHVRPLLFSVSHFSCSNFFQASRQFAVAFGFRHFWGVCLHLLPWSLLSHFFLHPVL